MVARATLMCVRRAERLAQHVVDAGLLEDGAGGATGDDAGTGAAGFSSTRPAPVLADDRVGDRASRRAARRTGSSWPPRCPSGWRGALPWPCRSRGRRGRRRRRHHERGEREPTAALDDLGDAVDVDDPRLAQPLRAVASRCDRGSSELQSGFAGGVGERGDAAVVEEPTAVEHDLGRRRRPWPARRRACRPAWPRRCCPWRRPRRSRLGGRGRGQRAAGVVVDHLRRRCACSTGTRPGADARRCRGPSCAPGGGAGCGLRGFVLRCSWSIAHLLRRPCRPCAGRARRA